MKKFLAILLYAVYSVTLVLTVTYGTGVAKKISTKIKSAMYYKNIDDVILTIGTDEALAAGGVYEFDYEVVGVSYDEAEIKFESLTPDIAEVSYGKLYTYSSFDGEEAAADIKITSKRDPDFEKTVTVKVKKFYPEEVKVSYFVEGCGYNKKTLEVGMAVYPYSYTEEKNKINQYELIFDEEYFRFDEKKGAYIAIKETADGEALTFSVRYPNGTVKESEAFTVISYVGTEDFDAIKHKGETVEELHLNVNQSFTPILYKNGSTVNTIVDISCDNTDGVSIGKSGEYIFKKAGDYNLTFTLPNGFSRSVKVTVRNVLSLPEIVDTEVFVDGFIKVPMDDSTVIRFTYPSGVTFTGVSYEVNNDCVSVNDGWRSFTVVPNRPGTCTVTMVIDDGYERLEKSYDIMVVEGVVMEESLRKRIDNFVTKFLGHTIFFAVLAFFSMNMFKHFKISNLILRFSLYLMTALPWAALTEIIQIYMPGRYARVEDVGIDMCGFMAGTLIVLIVRLCKKKLINSIL